MPKTVRRHVCSIYPQIYKVVPSQPQKTKSTGDISDKCKQTLHKTVYSWALKQDVGNTGFSARGVSAPGMKKR